MLWTSVISIKKQNKTKKTLYLTTNNQVAGRRNSDLVGPLIAVDHKKLVNHLVYESSSFFFFNSIVSGEYFHGYFIYTEKQNLNLKPPFIKPTNSWAVILVADSELLSGCVLCGGWMCLMGLHFKGKTDVRI